MLFLSPESPYPLIGGGALRSASLLNFLASHHAVDLIVFREPGAPDPRPYIPPDLVRSVHVIDLRFHARNSLARAARNAGRLIRGVPPLLDRFAGYEEAIAAATGGQRYDLCVIEHFWCAPYWEQLSDIAGATLLDLHNIESVLHRLSARTESGAPALAHRAFARICRDLEADWLPRYTYLLAASGKDARRIRHISPSSKVLVYPNSIPWMPQPPRPEENVMVFSGNLEYHPNIAAVRYFHDEIWPELRANWPALVWRLIGKNPEAVAGIVAGDNRIELLGPVDDAVLELARARVAIVPLLAGSGTRIKIIEAWAAGTPVVSTTIGAEGLSARGGEHLLLADRPKDFAAAVSRLLSDAALRDRIGRTGRYLFDCEFNWQAAWKQLKSLYPVTMVGSDAFRD